MKVSEGTFEGCGYTPLKNSEGTFEGCGYLPLKNSEGTFEGSGLVPSKAVHLVGVAWMRKCIVNSTTPTHPTTMSDNKGAGLAIGALIFFIIYMADCRRGRAGDVLRVSGVLGQRGATHRGDPVGAVPGPLLLAVVCVQPGLLCPHGGCGFTLNSGSPPKRSPRTRVRSEACHA